MGWRPDLSQPYVQAFASRARIDCEHLFEFRCPLYWGELRDTAEPTRRFCDACQQPVHLVSDLAELRARAGRRECVAVILPQELPRSRQGLDIEDGGRHERPMMMGRISRVLATDRDADEDDRGRG